MTDYEIDLADWVASVVVDTAGDKVGRVRDIFVDDETGRPVWLAVATGRLERHLSFVPVAGAGTNDGRVMIAWDRATVKDSPHAGREGEESLSPAQVADLSGYYSQRRPKATGTVPEAVVGPDGVMTRSEERAHFGVRLEEVGRARLRKYVVSERVTRAVAVAHEEIRVERIPLTGVDRIAVGIGLTEEEYELTLFAERPDVQKEVVAVERVRMSKEIVRGEETVSTNVRKEQIVEEIDADAQRSQSGQDPEPFDGRGART